MSWDVSVMRFRGVYQKLGDIPNDEECVSIGTRNTVQQAISAYFPGVDWTNPGGGKFDSPFGSIEFQFRNDDPCTGFTMHMRASEEIVAPVVAMCLENQWQAFDMTTNLFLEKSVDPTCGLVQWQCYRNSLTTGT
jgi:hypothetical protein